MQPINNIQWIYFKKIKANNYNPNHVLKQEMQLIKHSILKNGWLHPIIINKDYTIIDGYHRVTLIKTDKELQQLTTGNIPCIILDLSDTEQKLLTIRINRAKGTQTAYKMHEVIKDLYNNGLTIKQLSKEIGAKQEEIQLLIHDNIFQKEQITDETQYNQAWTPK